MRIALCDDEEKDLQALKEAVSAFDQNSQLEIYDFSHASKLFAAAKIKPFDIAMHFWSSPIMSMTINFKFASFKKPAV